MMPINKEKLFSDLEKAYKERHADIPNGQPWFVGEEGDDPENPDELMSIDEM